MKKRTRYIVCAAVLAAACILTALAPQLSASAAGTAPVAENLELTTYRNVSVGGKLSAVDPDGGALTFTITTDPVKGQVELSEGGQFVYTPGLNRRGRDYFGYRAADAEGNVSQEATVIIRIQKQKTAVTYADMAGSGDAYAAAALAEADVFTGSRIGGAWVFEPDRAVTRGEFLTMCMAVRGGDVLSGVLSTGFSDDGDIPAWQKPYVATALMDGAVSGYADRGEAVFSAAAPITCSEAAVLLDSLLELTQVSSVQRDEAVPAWAEQSVSDLSACGMLPDGVGCADALTRADAARMLVRAMDVLSVR